MGKVLAICISEKRGTQKSRVEAAEFVEDWGIKNDAHAGKWHRQVSLLSAEQVEDFRNKGAEVLDGAFGENLVVEGFDFKNLPVGTIFKCNDVVLELTQIGKQCHSHCEIYKVMGDCIMPREGVFTKVLHGAQSTSAIHWKLSMCRQRQSLQSVIRQAGENARIWQGRRLSIFWRKKAIISPIRRLCLMKKKPLRRS